MVFVIKFLKKRFSVRLLAWFSVGLMSALTVFGYFEYEGSQGSIVSSLVFTMLIATAPFVIGFWISIFILICLEFVSVGEFMALSALRVFNVGVSAPKIRCKTKMFKGCQVILDDPWTNPIWWIICTGTLLHLIYWGMVS